MIFAAAATLGGISTTATESEAPTAFEDGEAGTTEATEEDDATKTEAVEDGGDPDSQSGKDKKEEKKENKDPKMNSHDEKVYTVDEFYESNKGKTYKEIINQRPQSSGFPGGPKMRYVLNPIDGYVMDMRHVLVVGFQVGIDDGALLEVLQSLKAKTRPSAFDKQDFYSNEVGSQFYKYYTMQNAIANQTQNKCLDITTALHNFFNCYNYKP